MIDFPKISIVTPSFNQGKFLERTILSVLEQQYPNLEYIIIDGGSSDGSVEIIKKYEKQLAYWISEKDQGQSHAINKGFERATGEILGWLNSDDYYTPGALQAVMEVFRKNPGAAAVVGTGEMVDEEGKTSLRVEKSSITLESLFHWQEEFFWQPSCFFTRKAWNRCGPLDVNIHYAMDLDYWIKIAQKYNFITMKRLLSISLKHEKAKTTEFDYLSKIDAFLVVLRHGGELEARRGLEHYAKQLSESVAGYEKYVSDLNKQLSESIEGYEKQVSELNAQINSLQEESNDLKQYSKQLSESVVGYEKQVSELNAQINSLREERDDLKQYSKQQSERITGYEKQVSELNAQINSLREERNDLKQYSKQLSESVVGYEKQVSELNTQINSLREERDDLKKYSKQQSESIAGYENYVTHLNTRIDSLKEDIVNKEKRIAALHDSFSWKITRPFRMLVDIVYDLRSKITETCQPKFTLLFNVFKLFLNQPKEFIKNINYSTVSAFIKQLNKLDPLALEYEVRRKLAGEYEKPDDYWALFLKQVDQKKILVVDRFVPAYDTNSGALRMFTILNILVELGYKVTFMPDNLSPREPYVSELRSLGIEVVCGDVNIEEFLINHGPRFRYVFLSEAYPAFNLMSYVRAYAVNATVIYDTVDIHWLRLERAAAISKSDDVKKEAEYFKKMELFNIRSSDVVLTVTDDEKKYLESIDNSWKVAVLPNIHEVVTYGITPFEQRKDIMFIGHFLHDPNTDAVKYFAKDIFPLIKKEIPGIKFYIVGSNPVKEVMDLKSDDIEVTGYVKDVAPYFESCRVFVSPLRFGAGMKGKIGQSMTFGLPVVTTNIGAEGIGLTDEENVLIADDPVRFAQSVIKLYHDKCLWEKLSASSMQHIETHYSKQVVKKMIAELFESLGKWKV